MINGTRVFECADEAMSHLLDRIMTHGEESAPRGKKVRELLGEKITFDMRYPIVTKESRKMGYRFLPAEAFWILSGRNDLEFFRGLNMPFIWEFSDDGFFYNGAYGPRVVDQLTYVCDVLADDHDTRQAVIEVWRPNPRPSRDIPCTLSFQFIARGGRLHCVQSMRSSDGWLGYPYDIFNASMLSLYVILLLRCRKTRGRANLTLGTHTMMIGSAHVYEPQWESALKFIDDTTYSRYDSYEPEHFETPQSLLQYLRNEALTGIDPKPQRQEKLV